MYILVDISKSIILSLTDMAPPKHVKKARLAADTLLQPRHWRPERHLEKEWGDTTHPNVRIHI